MRVMGDDIGKWASSAVTCCTPDALRRAVDSARDAGADEYFLVPTTADPSELARARATRWGSDGRRRVVGRRRRRAAAPRLRRPHVPRGAGRALAIGHRGGRPQRDRDAGARRPGAGEPRQPAPGHRMAPHPSGTGRDAGRGAADPRGHAAQRHHRAESPARSRSRQPVVARLGSQRVDPAADHRHLPGRSALRRHRARRRARSTSSTRSSSPSTTTNPTTRWSARCCTRSTSRA